MVVTGREVETTEAPAPPVWVSAADVATLLLLACALLVWLTGGLRMHLAGVRLSVTSWGRVLVVALVVAGARHAAFRRAGLPYRLGAISAAAYRGRAAVWQRWPATVRVLLVALFLVSVARFYLPGAGFTRFILFGLENHPREVPLVQALDHAHETPFGYDGQFYAQIALDPLLRHRWTSDAMDNAPYRARRILMPAVAYVAGLGRPWAVIQAYALINVFSWLLLALYLHRHAPAADGRALAAWAGCLFSFGMLASVRMALPDGPAVVLIALAVAAHARSRPAVSSGVLGVSLLLRETNVLAAVALGATAVRTRIRAAATSGWIRSLAGPAAHVLLVAVPLLAWLAYLRYLYGPLFLEGGQRNFAWPLTAYLNNWRIVLAEIGRGSPDALFGAYAMAAVGVQAAFLLGRPRRDNAWWRVGVAYVGLMLVLGPAVWEGSPAGAPGAYPRVLLPMQVAFNLTLLESRRFWWLFVPGNLSLLAGLRLLEVPGIARLL